MIIENHYLCYAWMVCFCVSEYVTTQLYVNFIKLLINELLVLHLCVRETIHYHMKADL
jgi:hypothetical protein